MATNLATGLWCDDFDADLLKVVPNAAHVIREVADVRLRTYSHETNGKINCPSAWWTDHGLTAFFATDGYGGAAPPGYMTDEPLVECTFLEAVRDEWIHDATIIVNGRFVWKPPEKLKMDLMYDLRGRHRLTDDEREGIRESVRLSLDAARRRLGEILLAGMHCDCRADDWVEGDEGAIRCVQCGGYAGEPGTAIRLTEVSNTESSRDVEA